MTFWDNAERAFKGVTNSAEIFKALDEVVLTGVEGTVKVRDVDRVSGDVVIGVEASGCGRVFWL